MRLGFSKILFPLLGTLAISFSESEAQTRTESDQVVMQQSRPFPSEDDPFARKKSSPKHYTDYCRPTSEDEDPTRYYIRPLVTDYGFYVYGGFLYWLPFGLDLDYAVKANGTTYTSKSFVKYDWQPGFKAGLGYAGKSAWDLDLSFHYVHPDGNDASSVPPGESLISSFDKGSGTTFQQAVSAVRLEYMMGDLDFGRRIFVWHDWFTLRFLFGFKGGWIQQKWDSEFFGTAHNTFASNEWDIVGAGPKVGAQFLWTFVGTFGFYGKSSFAAMIIREKFNYVQTQSTNVANVNLSTTEHKLAPTVDVEVGLAWAPRFNNDRWGFNISAGYQLTCWWNIAQRMRLNSSNLVDASQAGDLYLQGLVTRAGLDF